MHVSAGLMPNEPTAFFFDSLSMVKLLGLGVEVEDTQLTVSGLQTTSAG